MKIFISAAETSSDAHGADLLIALRALVSQSSVAQKIEAWGVGGPKLQAAGLRASIDAKTLLAMGFSEILGILPRIFRALHQLEHEASENPPDLAVVIDYPDFHFRLAKRFKKLGIPVIYYIPPKVWAWRKGRIRFLQKYFVKILSILPFEEEFYQHHHVPVTYVGNPLVDQLPLDLTQSDARKKLGLRESDRVLILMPGSRRTELKMHLELMLSSAFHAQKQLVSCGYLKPQEPLYVLLPFPVTADLPALDRRVNDWKKEVGLNDSSRLSILISQGNAAECLVAADAGLIKSGTSTLEAGLLQCPHSIVYKTSLSTALIFKYLIRYQGPVGLVNLVAGWKPGQSFLIPEILLEKVTQESLTQEIVKLMTDETLRARMKMGFKNLRQRVCGQAEGESESQSKSPAQSIRRSPSQFAAREILQIYSELKRGQKI